MQLRRQPLFLDLRRAAALSLPAAKSAFGQGCGFFFFFFFFLSSENAHKEPQWLSRRRKSEFAVRPAAFFFFFRRLSEELSEDSWRKHAVPSSAPRMARSEHFSSRLFVCDSSLVLREDGLFSSWMHHTKSGRDITKLRLRGRDTYHRQRQRVRMNLKRLNDADDAFKAGRGKWYSLDRFPIQLILPRLTNHKSAGTGHMTAVCSTGARIRSH